MKRPSLEKFKEKALKKKGVKEAYESLIPDYIFRKEIVKLRKKSGLTQEQVAELLHTKKSNISRLENLHSSASPRLSTIANYAKALGYQLKLSFSPLSRS